MGDRSEDRDALNAELARTEPAASASASGPGADVASLAADTVVGRYVIVELLGAGAMGVVYTARDPSLDRLVALKLMAPGRTGSAGGSRLLREAQALARLSHPNVIAVHDVGFFGDQVFIAMELVRGKRLADLLRTGARPWRELLPLFLQAGEGLAAAHAAGLIHRDFKPENVLVGEDGRVRVLDFGLARAAEGADSLPGADEPAAAPSDSGRRALNPLSTPLTEMGAVIGTPAYMAPEQFRRGATDARTDQWAFCVGLYTGLFGQHPFGGDTYAELAERVLADRVRPPPASSPVPARLRRIVLRGLAARPEDRYPSMAALLGELRAFERSRRIGWYALAAAGLLVVAGATVLLARAQGGAADPVPEPVVCPTVESRLAGVWDDQRRAAARKAFAATGRTYAEASFAATAQLVDAYAAAWVSANQAACIATHVDGTQSEELLDLRVECLNDRLQSLRALTDLLVAADDKTVLRAVPAAGALESLEGCADGRMLRLRQRPPGNPDAQARLTRLEAGIDEAQALYETGRYPEGLERARALAGEAGQLGFRPVEARALYVLGNLQMASGAHADARRSLEAAALAAEAGRDDELLVRALNSLVFLVGDQLALPDEATGIARRVEAALERLGGHERERGILVSYLGQIHWTAGRYPEAQRHQEQALAILERELGKDHIRIASVLLNLGNALDVQGRNREAEPVFRRALAIRTRLLGERHPAVADIENSLGNCLDAGGDLEAAGRHFEHALAVWEEALGPEHPRVAVGLDNLARMRRARGQHQEAVAMHRRALEIRTRVFGPDHPQVATSLCSLGNSLLAVGKHAEAWPLYQRSLAVDEKAFGPDYPQLACAIEGLGQVLTAQGKPRVALQHLQRSLALREKSVGTEHPDLTWTLLYIGRAHLRGGDPARARPVLERARRLCPPQSHDTCAEIDTLLGRTGGSR